MQSKSSGSKSVVVRIALKARAVGVYLVLGASSVSELKKKLRSDAALVRRLSACRSITRSERGAPHV
jgi:hypothetical protein